MPAWTAPDIGPFSEQVALWIRSINGADRTVCVAGSGVSRAAAPVAAAFASVGGLPVVVGMTAARRVAAPAYLVGPEVAGRTAELPGSQGVGGGSVTSLSVALADLAVASGSVSTNRVVLAPRTIAGLDALAGLGAPVVLHEPGSLDGARNWLAVRAARVARVDLLGASGALGTGAYKELQSIMNDFQAYKLIGVGGQGLPVIPQPIAERPIGRARRGALDAEEQRAAAEGRSYWTSRARGG